MEKVKLFTPAQADQTLPLVKKVVADILKLGSHIRERSAQIGTGAENDKQIVDWMGQLEELFEELESLGCSYKDWNFTAGLVDFPSVIDGREVFLCWRSDEERLQYYHDVDSGFSGRKLIPNEYLSGPIKK